jgi:predicted amidohydrolase YtcJ
MHRLLLFNACIYTQDPSQPQVSAILLQGERILAIGTEAQTLPAEERLDLEGRVVIPGLTDAHLHLEHFALGLQKVDCETPTRQECLQRVAERCRQTPPGQWVLGHGWNQNLWPEGFGRAADLDAVAPDHPVYLTAKSLHAGWANSLALRLPKALANETHITEGTRVELVRLEEGVLLKAKRKPHYRLSELLAGVTKKNLHPETDWGRSVGREVLE